MPPDSTRSEQAAGIFLIRLAVGIVLAASVAKTWADPDLWGHIKFGYDILHGGLTTGDPYSFTSDIPWVNHEWLAEMIMYTTWAGSGGGGLIVLKMAALVATLGFVALTLRDDRLQTVTRDLLVFVVLIGLWARVFVVRPQLFSLVLFAMLLWILRSADRGRTAPLWLAPFVFVIWVNLHGGWIVGLGTFLLWAGLGLAGVGTGIARTGYAGIAAVAILATLANPYTIDLWAFLGRTVRLDRPNINDWRPLTDAGAEVIVPWMLSAFVAAASLLKGRRRVPLRYALIVIGLGLASIRVNRLDAFFCLSSVMLLGRHMSDASGIVPNRPRWTRLTVAGAAALAIATGVGSWQRRDALSCIRLDGPWMPEREAGAFIVANRLHGRLLSWFDWGQYAIWHFSPDLKVSLDGRRETVYSDAFVARHLRLYLQPETEMAMVDELRPDYAWLPVSLPLTAALERAGWYRLYSGGISVILGRESQAERSPQLASRPCFPGP
jgi:hypothetical protein